MNNLIYNIHDTPRTFKELFLYALQQLLAVFVATVLIANICGTPVSSCLFGACCGTLLYQLITRFSSPMFISSSGATCSAVIGALAIGGYTAVAVGGIVIALIYLLFGLLVKAKGVNAINKIFPPAIIGAVTIVIGANLATFIPTYVSVGGEHSNIGIIVALLTMLVIAISSHYCKGFLKTIPFLIGLLFGYIVCILLTIFGYKMIDFSVFSGISILSLPDFTFLKWDIKSLNLSVVIQTIVLFVPVAICAMLEHISDHKVLSNIIGTDLTKTPGLDKTLIGDGTASLLGTILCGLPNTSYGESIATTGFSRVASVRVITVAALLLGSLSFITPVQAFINSIPSCVFGGCSMILYGFIIKSGLSTLHSVDINDSKNTLIICAVLTIGISGIWFLSNSFSGTALSMVVGVLLNLILKEKEDK